MKSGFRKTDRAASVPGGLAVGAGVSVLTTLILAAIIAYLMGQEQIQWESVGYWIMTILFVSSFIGAKTAFTAVRRQRLLISGMSGLLYWTVLLCMTALFFGGAYDAVWETAAIIGAGSGCAALLIRPEKKQFRPKVKKGNR